MMTKDHGDASMNNENRKAESEGNTHENAKTKEKTVNPQIVISFIVLFIFAIFAAVNTQAVSINFVFTDVEIPLIIVILGSFILGVVTAALTSWRSHRRK